MAAINQNKNVFPSKQSRCQLAPLCNNQFQFRSLTIISYHSCSFIASKIRGIFAAANNFPNEYDCGQRSQTGKIEIQSQYILGQ